MENNKNKENDSVRHEKVDNVKTSTNENTKETVTTSNNGENEYNIKKMKKGFFKKVWYSVFKLERYGEMSAEGLFRALSYLIKLTLIVTLIITIGTISQILQLKDKGEKFLNEQIGNFTYKEGILQLEDNTPIRAPSSTFGEVVVDVNTESEEEINQYINSLKENRGIIILKDKVLIRGIANKGTISYNYKSVLDDLNIKEANKETVLNYFNFQNLWQIYIVIIGIFFIYTLINTLLPFIFDAVLLSIVGFVATLVAKIRIRYVAIFNLAIYSMTLSIILYALYIVVNLITKFNITYFQVMYISVAAIYIIAAILLIKSDFLARQVQVSSTMTVKKQEEKEQENEEENKDSEDDKKDKKENPDEDEKNKKDTSKGTKKGRGEEPEGSQA